MNIRLNMKKCIMTILAMFAAVCTTTKAQDLYEGEMAVVYHMPMTQLAITITYDEITHQPGEFYQYAERYLGVKEVVTAPQTRYHMTHISIAPHTIADQSRTYKVSAQDGGQWLSLTPQGTLYGFNVEACEQPKLEITTVSINTNEKPTLMPLLEEQMVASSIAKMAEGAAKMIYHIRETRLNILAGDVEHTPADGHAMQLVLDELDQREQALVELFIGKQEVKQHKQTIYYTPDKDIKDFIIARMSQYNGVVPANNLSGEPITITITGSRKKVHHLSAEAEQQKSKAPAPSAIHYNLPGSAQVILTYNQQILTNGNYPIAQYGVAVPLAKNLLTSKKSPKIYFNTQTGNILSIQQ